MKEYRKQEYTRAVKISKSSDIADIQNMIERLRET